MTFEFATAGRVVFGPGTLAHVGGYVQELGRHALVVTGRNPQRGLRLEEILRSAGLASTPFPVAGEPTTHDVERGAAQARQAGCDFVIGLGGGSALDAAKAIAALLTNSTPLLDHLEVIGRALPLTRPAAPCVAIPTTAGTGAEVTRNAVLASPEHRVKVSLRHSSMLPRLAVVDPELTYDLPPSLTASTGLDALTQLIEPYVCVRAQPLTDAICVAGLVRAARSLRRVVEDGTDHSAREDMAFASVCGGMALANAGLGAVHGFAGPIGGAFPAPHGAVCAALLPGVVEMNLRAMRARAPQSRALARYDEIARLLTGRPQATAAGAVIWLRELVTALRIPGLAAYGITREHLPALVEAGGKASSMKANPLVLTPEECAGILSAAL